MNSLQRGLQLIDPKYTHVLEFGVWKGTSLHLIRDTLASRYDVYGFDSFQGLPEDWPETDCKKGHFSTQGLEPYVPGAVIFAGWFKDTLPTYLFQAQPIALIHLDCDLYSSTKEVLVALNRFIMPGTILVCDEWIYTKSDGSHGTDQEQKAVWEWATEFDRKLEWNVEYTDPTPCGHERMILKVVQ